MTTQSHFEIDVNCPTCFNAVLQTLLDTDGVDEVQGHAAHGCVSVTHHIDESQLQSVLTTVGHTIDVAGNGELVMGQAHARPRHRCDCPR
ncbi:hypothetical protein [Ilumatobacter sp.]|uniref:hypothetical protein n=1 Tax=Ilumatobacter sp. TaxID=1967498 RepID=UPI003C3FEB63